MDWLTLLGMGEPPHLEFVDLLDFSFHSHVLLEVPISTWDSLDEDYWHRTQSGTVRKCSVTSTAGMGMITHKGKAKSAYHRVPKYVLLELFILFRVSPLLKEFLRSLIRKHKQSCTQGK